MDYARLKTKDIMRSSMPNTCITGLKTQDISMPNTDYARLKT